MDNLLPDNLTGQPPDYPSLLASLLAPLPLSQWTTNDISADILRLDQLHPVISGNKWFKLKGHLQLALQSSGHHVITFGGAWSNHLVATACAAHHAGLASTGIVRGERPPVLSATLISAGHYGMQLEFITRREYAEKDSPGFLERLAHRYPGAYIIPEGGAGIIGVRGCEDILGAIDISNYTHIACAVGTGTMFLGLLRASLPGQLVIGVPILRGIGSLPATPYLSKEQRTRALLLDGYHFGGYARHPQQLLDFMNDFHRTTGIPSDIVYTGKLFYAVLHKIRENYFPASSRLLLIHSGGLQGNLSLSSGILDF